MPSQEVILCLLINGALSTSIVQCPLNKMEWENRSNTLFCQGKDVYHCLLMEDTLSRKEKCIETTMIGNGFCPILTTTGYLHWSLCNVTGCPKERYRSNEVYKYPLCFGDIKDTDNEQKGEDKAFPLPITIPSGIVLLMLVVVITIITCKVLKRKRQTPKRPSGFSYLKTGDSESAKMIENPEYIRNGIHQLKSRNKLYIIGQLGNSVSTSGKKITEEYANSNNMSYEYYNYLDIAKKFSELRPEKVFKLNTANFIDGWGGLWNENPCEKQITFDTMVKVVEQSQTIEKLKFVIGLRTEIGKELERRGIQMEEHEKLLLDCSSIYKREKVKEEIEVLQNSCSNEKCGCKSLTYERVSGINQVPIGNYLVVRLMSLDHTMILDFLMREVGPLEAMRNHFEKLMEEGQIWQWLPYFVCLGYYDKDQFRHDIADGFNISQSMFLHCESIAKYIKPKKELAPLWSTRFCCDPHVKKQDNNPSDVVVFWHTFLYICAFHACFKKYPKQMLRFCNLDAILQLVRPKDYHDPLTIVADDKEVDFFYNERLKNRAIVSSLSEHPLVKERRNRRKSRGIKTLFKKHA